jgi:LuxR family maltose regulon positive regulatory protein
MQGRLEEALQLARDVERLAWQGGQLFPSTATARALLEAGAVLRERNHLDEAERILRQCLDLCTQFAGHGYHVIACLYLAQVLQARCDAAAAWAWLDRAQTGLRAQPAWPASAQEIAGYRILLALACDDQATADAWAATQDPAAPRPLTPFALDRFALARTYMAQQRWEAAHATLDALAQAAEAGGFGSFLIWSHCLQALTFQAQKQPERALDALSRALIRAAPEGYVRVFVDEGAPMAALLRAIRTRNVTPAYVYRLLDAFSPASADESHQPPDQSALVEPLTARELEVLRLIAAGASNQGVADALILSVGTVKKHINNILGKLGVHSRTHALARARELGLL